MGSDQMLRSARGQESLELRFRQHGDRQGHSLAWVREGQSTTMLESLEGDDQSAWPPSPPLQQLSIEQRETGDVALLVGMAGKSHWSLSVEALPDGALRFEAACRLSPAEAQLPAHARWLGSTYRIAGIEPVDLCDSAAGDDEDGGAPRARADLPLQCTVPDHSQAIEEHDQWTLRPATMTVNDRGLAVWGYTLRLRRP